MNILAGYRDVSILLIDLDKHIGDCHELYSINVIKEHSRFFLSFIFGQMHSHLRNSLLEYPFAEY